MTLPNTHEGNGALSVSERERQSQLAAADVIIARDPLQDTRTVLFGREVLEDIARSRRARDAVVVTVSLDFGSDELDDFDALVRQIKGSSSFRPADLFPEFSIDAESFRNALELLEAVRRATDEIRAEHRRLLPRVQRRFYYAVRAAGFPVANEELRRAAQEAGQPVSYVVSVVTLGHVLYGKLPSALIRPTHCVDIEHNVGPQGRVLGVTCRSLLSRETPGGTAYFSRRMPRMKFGDDGREWLVAFSQHALERICERTVYDWRTYGGLGDAFAFFDNCVYFEDCTAVRGEPSFAIYNSCVPHFTSWHYVERILGAPLVTQGDAHANIAQAVTGAAYYYRVGYCPVSFHGDLALATTLLVPGMNRRRGTPEGRLIERAGLPVSEVTRMRGQVESQLSMKALADTLNFDLLKWFHDNGVHQVVRMDRDVFRYG